MSKINLTINAETAEELQQILATFGLAATTESNPADPHAEKKEEPKQKKQTTKKTTKATEKKKEDKAPAETVSTDSTSEEKDTTTVKDDEPEKSITQGQYPDATKADVQAAMKKALDTGNRDQVKVAFGRFNASKLSDLKEEDYSAFLTDLEALVGE